MSLIVPTPTKPYEHKQEYENDYWQGQMRHYIWLETHDEDCDYHYNNFDMEPHD